jgi:hypothetical protein
MSFTAQEEDVRDWVSHIDLWIRQTNDILAAQEAQAGRTASEKQRRIDALNEKFKDV